MERAPEIIESYFSDHQSAAAFRFPLRDPSEFKKEYELVDWLIHSSHWPYFPLQLPDFPYAESLAEAKKLKELFVGHREADLHGSYKHHGWKSLCLHGVSATHTNHWENYPELSGKSADQIPYSWTHIADSCPATYHYFKNIFPMEKYERLRFMWLQPGGYIQPHRDRLADPILAPMNIALNMPEGCFFKMTGKGYIPFQGNDAYLLDIGNEHAVWNNSEEDRFHIIVHGKYGSRWKEFRALVYQSYLKFYEEKSGAI